MTAQAIATQGLTKHFGEIKAVVNLDLSVERGEVFGYLGPNGAGKTTTIRLLFGFLRPTAGSARVLGGAPGDPAVRARMGFLPADLAVDPRYTARDLLDFYAKLRSNSQPGPQPGPRRGGHDPAWENSLLERFDLDPTRRFGELSTGNRRKLGLIQAFAHRPELLVLDEPTSGLDPLLQAEFNRLIREVVAAGTTVFLSSHVLPEVETLASRVGILRRGELVTVAGITQLRSQARTRVALLLAEPARPDAFSGVPGVVDSHVEGANVYLVVEGAMDQLVKRAATLPVLRLTTHEADLEEVFLSYYTNGTQGGRR